MDSKNRYEKEIGRHNRAVEELARAKEKWYENEVKKKDDIMALKQKLLDANNIASTNAALDQLKMVTTIVYQGQSLAESH